MSVEDENTSDESDDGSSCRLPFLTLFSTRWLVRGEVLQRILSNWNDLKTYFSSATFDQKSNFKGSILKDMLVDDLTYLYICFITPIIKEFDKINKFFQATNADPEAMTQQLEMHYRSLRGRVFDIDGNQLSISRVDFGAKFESESLRCIRKHEASDFSTHLIKVKERCRMFLLELIAQIEQRLPTNRNIFAGLSFLKPSKVLSHINRPAFHNLSFQNMLHDSDDVDEIEEQFRKIILRPWAEEDLFQGKVPEDALQFWAAVQSFKDVTGSYSYRSSVIYALACLSTPVSNALVERVFSHINVIKTDKRNKMGLKMIEATTRLRTTVIGNNKGCKDFAVTREMLQKFNSDMYEFLHENDARHSKI